MKKNPQGDTMSKWNPDLQPAVYTLPAIKINDQKLTVQLQHLLRPKKHASSKAYKTKSHKITVLLFVNNLTCSLGYSQEKGCSKKLLRKS